MKIIYIAPGKEAIISEIGDSLQEMQQAVNGYIEAIYPFEDPVAVICNEEGKINDMPFCRVLVNDDLMPVDIICGPFFICGLSEEGFTDIPEELVDKYLDRFLMAEHIVPAPHGILVTKYHNKKEE